MLSAEHYRQILDHSSDVHWMLDCDSDQLLYVSPSAEQLFGYVPELAQQVAESLMGDLFERLEAFTSGDATRPLSIEKNVDPPMARSIACTTVSASPRSVAASRIAIRSPPVATGVSSRAPSVGEGPTTCSAASTIGRADR